MWRFLLISALLVGAGCTKKNPAVCCTSPADCSALGIQETERKCDEGFVCIGHQCELPPDGGAPPPCETNDDCNAAAPYCSEDLVCVECLNNEHCSQLEPVCDMHACRGCTKDEECSSAVCDRVTGVCIGEEQVLYASPAGGANAPCNRLDTCNISRALQLVDTARRRIKMAAGTYTAALTIDKPVVVHGYGATLSATAGALRTIQHVNGADSQLLGLTVLNTNIDGVGVGCEPPQQTPKPILAMDEVSVDSDNTALLLYGCSATVTRTRLKTRTSTDRTVTVLPTSTALIDRSTIDGGDGVWVEGTNSVARVTNSLLKNLTGPEGAFVGSNLFGAGPGTVHVQFSTVINSRVVCGGGVPACAGGSGTGSCVENSIIYNGSPSAPADTVQASCVVANYVLVFPQSTSLNGSNNQYGVNPMFQNLPGADYHLMDGSPAVDAADPAATNMMDFDGLKRPQGVRSDIGAFEKQP